MKKTLSHKLLLECVSYNKETGIFTWKKRPLSHFKTEMACKTFNTRFCSAVCGSKLSNGYMKVRLFGADYLSHRMAYFYVNGVFPQNQIDHINGVRTDNKFANLRSVTNKENSHNRQQLNKNSSTGLTGVTFDKARKLFVSSIQIDGKHKHLGRFKSKEEAYEAYLKAKRMSNTSFLER